MIARSFAVPLVLLILAILYLIHHKAAPLPKERPEVYCGHEYKGYHIVVPCWMKEREA